jgi:hypothetical protein
MKTLRRFGRTLFVVALLAGIAGATQPVSAASPIRYLTATIDPTSAPAGSTYNATFTVRNSTQSTQSIGSANVTAPAGFTVTGAGPASAPAGKTWTATNASGVIQLRAGHNSDVLAPGEAVSTPVTATVSCTVGTSTWNTAARTSLNFTGSNDFLLEPGASYPTTSVTAGGGSSADHFDVALPGSPYTATAGQAFTATITAQDVCGNTASGYSGSATLSGTLNNAPNGATPTYGTVSSFSSGVATVSVTAVKAEASRTVTATAGSVTGTSAAFDVRPGDPASLSFTQQPSLTKVNVAISPAVAVTLYDQFGNVATQASDNVTLTLAHDSSDHSAGDGQLGGTASQTPSAGVATFGDLTVSKSSNRYFLHASYGTLTQDSAFFDIVNLLIGCGDSGCSGSYDNGLNTVSADVPGKHGTQGFLALSLDNAAGSVPCTKLDGTVIDQPVMGALQTVIPPAGYDTPSIPVTVRYDKTIAPGTGVANFVFCANHGGNTPFFEIPTCPKHGQPSGKCISSRRRNGVGDLIITFLFSSTDPVGGGYGGNI